MLWRGLGVGVRGPREVAKEETCELHCAFTMFFLTPFLGSCCFFNVILFPFPMSACYKPCSVLRRSWNTHSTVKSALPLGVFSGSFFSVWWSRNTAVGSEGRTTCSRHFAHNSFSMIFFFFWMSSRHPYCLTPIQFFWGRQWEESTFIVGQITQKCWRKRVVQPLLPLSQGEGDRRK